MAAGYSALAYVQIQTSIEQFHHQRQAEQLAHLLYEVDRVAGALEFLAQTDPLAAGIIACMRSRALASFDVALLPTFEQKKAWDAAVSRMSGLWSAVERNRDATTYVMACEEFVRWQRTLGDRQNNETALVIAVKGARHSRIWPTLSIWLGALLLVLGVLSAIGGYVSVLLVLGPALIIGGILWRRSSANGAQIAEAAVESYRQRLREFDAFMADPYRGGTLARVSSQHPALVSFDPARSPVASPTMSGQAPPSSHVIERQVIVARCRYCGQMTPVDLAGCKFCGGRI